MRRLSVAAVLSGTLAIASAALAEDEIDAVTLDAVVGLATRDYPDPAAATVRNVHKSLAANGHGYCGEVSAASGDGSFTVFHVLLESAVGPSVLLLSDFPDPVQSSNASVVHLMLKNFGCVE